MVADGDHLVHGLRVRFGRVLPGALAADGSLDYRVGALSRLGTADGELLARLGDAARGYEATRSAGVGLRIRYHRVAEFEVDRGAQVIRCRDLSGAPDGLSDVLLQGGVLALALGDAGVPVMHASTVAFNGALLAFVGPSGAGKSTAAALACLAGAKLFGDDTLRVDVTDGGHVAHRGVAELRLRAGAVSLAGLLPGSCRTTADGRTAVVPPSVANATGALRAILAPRWNRDAAGVRLERLSEGDALRTLIAAPRVVGWRAPEPIRANFAASAELARSVPAWALELPHGRPLDADLASELRQALERSGIV